MGNLAFQMECSEFRGVTKAQQPSRKLTVPSEPRREVAHIHERSPIIDGESAVDIALEYLHHEMHHRSGRAVRIREAAVRIQETTESAKSDL